MPVTALAIAYPDTLMRHRQSRNFAALGEFAGIIVKDRVLELPTGIFKGINRPIHTVGVDNFIFIYVSKPSCTYKFVDAKRSANVLIAPKNSVFVTYLTLSRVVIQQVREQTKTEPEAFRGVILGWEWVPEAAAEAGLPVEHAKRYKGRLWK